jgi:uncharacterized protein
MTRKILRVIALAFASLTAAPAAAQPDTASQRPPAGVVERTVTIGSREWPVTGVLSVPPGEGPFPAMVLMHGSGPGTRDGDVGPNKVLRDIAWGLAGRGIAVVRYDKRTTAHAARFRALGREASIEEEFTDDALAAVRLAQAAPEVDRARVYVMGWSQSSGIAPGVVRQTGAAGTFLMAVSSRSAAEMIREQVQYAASVQPASGDTARGGQGNPILAQLDLLADPASPDSLLLLGRRFSYWRSMETGRMRADLTAMLAEGGRAMVAHGGRDYLVTDRDFETVQTWFTGQPRIVFRRYADLNHMMQPGVGRMTPAEYNQRRLVSEELIRDVADWIKAR